jgi:zinc protease
MLPFAVLLCSATLVAAPKDSPKDMSSIPELKYEQYKLPNGLNVILHEDHATPIVGVNIWYHVGSKDERPGRTGFAHLFEHMMFQGSKHYDKVYFGPIQTVGGKLNGSTATDRTNYWETVPSNYLELALWMESDRMGFLLPAMTQAKLDNQRDVVRNERRQSYENRPYGLVHEVILASMYPPDYPYSWPVIGSMTDLAKASREDIADFFRRYYHPANASLCIAGDFKPAEAKRLVEKYFGPIPAGPKVEHPHPAPPKLTEEKRVHMTDRVGLARTYIVWPTLPHYTADDAALDVLAHVLASGKTSRLYKILVREKQISQDVQAYQDGQEMDGDFSIVSTIRAGHTSAEVEKIIAEEIARLKTDPPTAEEIARAVNSFEAQSIRSLESVSEFRGRADRLNMYYTYTGDPGFLSKDLGRYGHVDAAAVAAVAKKYLGPGRVVVEVVPGNTLSITPDPLKPAEYAREKMAKLLPPLAEFTPTLAAESEARTELPKSGSEPKFSLPAIQRAKLANGLEIILVEKRDLPIVNMNLVFRGGRALDPADMPGLADMTAAMWDEGTPTRSSEAIAEQLGGLGASLGVSCDFDTSSVRLFSLKRNLDAALDIYTDVIRNPAFAEQELHRQRTITLGRLTQIRNEPTALATLATMELLYGPDHPYGHPHMGNPKSLGQIVPDDLKAFYKTNVRPETAGLIVVGDITLDEVKSKLGSSLGDWHTPENTAAAVNYPPPEVKPTKLVLIDKPGAAQSVIELAVVSTDRKSPDYFPLNVMNIIFGGQFSSRLNMNLREHKGYTYGARSALEWHLHANGAIVATSSVKTAVTAPALTEFMHELHGMIGAKPVDAKELDFCQKYVTRGYTAGFETPSQLAGQLESLFAFDLPDDYFNTVVPSITAVTTNDVMSVAKKYLTLDKMVVVVVGDREKIEEDLRKLPVGKDLTVLGFDEAFKLIAP